MDSVTRIRAGRPTAILLRVALAAALSGTVAMAQGPVRNPPPVLTTSLVGSDLYATYCASCHGRAGKGDGPAADALKVRPADLTRLSQRGGGVYPAANVRDRLNGSTGPGGSTAHGSTEMPVWGTIFRELDANASVARVRVDNLVAYLQSLQGK